MQRILQPGEIEALDHVSFPRVRLPQPDTLFAERAARLLQLAEGNAIADYLRFIARLVQAQARVASQLPAAEPCAPALLARAQANAMPVWSPAEALLPAWRDALQAVLQDLSAEPRRGEAAVPPALQPELQHLAQRLSSAQTDGAAAADDLDALAQRVLAGVPSADEAPAAPLVMAALQLVYAQQAASLDARTLPYTEPATVCPVCGSPPVASVLRIGGTEAGHRYLHCSLCCSEWHMVRVKCSHCESTRGLRYQGLGGAEAAPSAAPSTPPRPVQDQVALAETCDTCHSYRKLVNQEKDPYAEPLADDLATLLLDLLMAETAFQRASPNPMLALGADEDQGGAEEVEGVPAGAA